MGQSIKKGCYPVISDDALVVNLICRKMRNLHLQGVGSTKQQKGAQRDLPQGDAPKW